MDIILASSSDRRKRLLAEVFDYFECIYPPEERHLALGDAKKTTYEKAIFKSIWTALKNPKRICIGADTTCQLDDSVLEKPKDDYDAKKMICKISSKNVEIYTSICISKTVQGGELRYDAWTNKATLYFRKLKSAEIDEYIESGKWRGKAGGFNIEEEPIDGWIQKITGQKETVIGLSTKRLVDRLRLLDKL